jgi:molybdate-binding protein/DNA-binding transcriptional regulator YhcF (GntR family)
MDIIKAKIRLDYHSSKPYYTQITEQLQQFIVTGQIKAGDQLPTVRELARELKVNPNTVARAYLELEQKQIAVSRRRGGTFVSSASDDPSIKAIRQKHLSDIVNDDIIKVLSQGYADEELEAAFYTHLERWREERKTSAKAPDKSRHKARAPKVIRFVGSHDIALNMLLALLRQKDKTIEIQVTNAGSLGGLIALEENRAELAGIHLLDEETGEYNLPFIKRILPGREIAVVNLVYRIQGLMYAAGNPKNIRGVADLARPDIVFVNRQQGSGTRVLLDLNLKKQGITVSKIKGYTDELDTHLAVGTTITQGKADVGLGIEAAARSCGLDFLPLFRECYDLAIPGTVYDSSLLKPMLDTINSQEFKRLVNKVDGYDTSKTGTTTILNL